MTLCRYVVISSYRDIGMSGYRDDGMSLFFLPFRPLHCIVVLAVLLDVLFQQLKHFHPLLFQGYFPFFLVWFAAIVEDEFPTELVLSVGGIAKGEVGVAQHVEDGEVGGCASLACLAVEMQPDVLGQ